ncbi:MAG: putative peroxidase-related enzyme, partial [Chitinophagales bacterium]
MSRFEAVDAVGDAELTQIYQDIVANGFGVEGKPISFFTAMASRPDIINVVWQFSKAIIVEGLLPASVKQMIALSISRQNNCQYCSVMHRGALEATGVEAMVVESCANDPDTTSLSEPNRSIVQFALKAARTPAQVNDDDYGKLAELGLSDEEIAEALAIAGFTNFINT